MCKKTIIQGTDVLKAIAACLARRGVQPYLFSVPCDSDDGCSETAKRKICEEFKAIGLKCKYSDDGINILAISEKEWWHIECIGYAEESAESLRHEFNRAISKVISFYGHEKNWLPEKFQNVRQFIGISLPETQIYMEELKKTIGMPLRQKLNLWILLYDSSTDSIKSIGPNCHF